MIYLYSDLIGRAGGIETYLHALATHLQAEGFSIRVAVAERECCPLLDELEQRGIPVYRQGRLLGDSWLIRQRALMLWLRKELQPGDWVFCVRQPMPELYLSLVRLVHRKGARLAASWMFAPEFLKPPAGFARSFARAVQETDAVISVARCTVRQFSACYGYSGTVHVVPYHNLAFFTEAVPMPVGPPWRIGYMGRIDVKQKNLDTVVRAFARLHREDPHSELHLYGGGPDIHFLEELARSLGTGRAVTFHGGYDHRRDLPRIIADNHFFLYTSRFEGGPCFTLLELMQAGRYVVASRVGGIPDLYEGQPEAGLLVDSPNEHDIFGGMQAALARARAGAIDVRAVRQRYVGCFDLHSAHRAWLDALHLETPRRTGRSALSRSKRRLVWLAPTDQSGGVASVAYTCCARAHEEGHDVTLLFYRPSSRWFEATAPFRIDSLDVAPDNKDGPRALVSWLERERPDVVFLNGVGEVGDALPWLPSCTRVVYVVHDTARAAWRDAVHHAGCLDSIIAVSECVERRFRRRVRGRAPVYVVHNGTAFAGLPPSSARADDLVFLGGGNELKGAPDILRLWVKLLARGYEGEIHWFGAVPPPLEQQVRRLPNSERIHLHGRCPREDIFATCARSKVLLMLSREEPFGMATIEGMAMGCVPIAWDIDTGTHEIVTDGLDGYFVPLGDLDRLALTVERALDQHATVAPAAIETARTRFSDEVMWQRYSAMLDELLAAPAVERSRPRGPVPRHRAPRRYFQMLPAPIRQQIRSIVWGSPVLGYVARNFRGL